MKNIKDKIILDGIAKKLDKEIQICFGEKLKFVLILADEKNNVATIGNISNTKKVLRVLKNLK